MFIRIKSNPNSPRKSVQIFEPYRNGDKARQRIIKHVGIADDATDLEELQKLALQIPLDQKGSFKELSTHNLSCKKKLSISSTILYVFKYKNTPLN
jgi:hypothetical protein